MALVREWLPSKSKAVRRQTDGDAKSGSKGENHIITGPGPGSPSPNRLLYRSLVQFAHDYTDMASIIKIEFGFTVRIGNANHPDIGTAPRLRIRRATSPWADVTNGGENVWDPDDYKWPGCGPASPLYEAACPINPLTGKPQNGVQVWLDVTALVRPIIKAGLPVAGSDGRGDPNYGFVLTAPGTETKGTQRVIADSGDASVAAGNRPRLRVTYEPVNKVPQGPTLLGPATTGVSYGDSFEGQHNDPDLDPMSARAIRVWKGKASTGEPAWKLPDSLWPATSEETATGRFVVPLALATGLERAVAYEWEAQTKGTVGTWGAWSTRRALTISSLPPSVTASPLTPPVVALASALFGGTYLDAAGETNPLYQFQMQMQPTVGLDWNNPDRNVWDTGETFADAPEIEAKKVERRYGGRAIVAAGYTYRIRVQDNSLSWSGWSEHAFTLTKDYEIAPGFDDFPTTQMNRRAPVRIALFNQGAKRGPGTLLGYIDDPIDLGATRYLNGGGEMYFTLPALHPYVPSIEPHRVHYQVQQYYGDRYRSIFAGLITDFDADADTVVFYGTDYLGLLQSMVDERYGANAETVAPAGSKYVNQTLDYIIHDQLVHHRDLPNSPVGFISVPAASTAFFTSLPERATIYSTFSEALPFITGLLDSHKQGTGKEIRFWDRATDSDYKAFEWALVDNWGKDRPNIRLEYGGLVNDFRVVALGDFGTQVLAVGQKRGEVKVYRAKGKIVLPEATWGRRVKTRFYQDIIDQNDLQRRADEATAQLGKVGKRVAIALKADALQPFDGWDVGDSINVDIQRGAVDTGLYGSADPAHPEWGGYWTIYGVEWKYSPDGHSDMVLSVLPKQTAKGADADLIPSINPGVPLEWQVGYGQPDGFGNPPIASGAPALRGTKAPLPLDTDPIVGAAYLDLNTGCIYDLDQDDTSPTYGEYHETFCPLKVEDIPPSYVPDTDAPPVPVIKALIPLEATPQEDGTVAGALQGTLGYAPPSPAGLTDLSTYIVQSTRYVKDDLSGPDFDKASEWRAAPEDQTGTLDTFVVQPGALPGEVYYWRAAAVDHAGNRSAWSDPPASVTAASDDDGPPRVTGFAVLPGNTTLGAHWDPVPASDLDYVEVRIRQTVPTVDPTWVNLRATGTVIIIAGLKNTRPDLVPPAPVAYELQVRSVDTSGNTLHDPGTGTLVSVKAEEQPDQGWIASVTASPTAIPGDALVWSDVIIGNVFAGKINADWIKAGTLTVGTGAKKGAAAIEVWDNHDPPRLVGKWTAPDGPAPGGIEVHDPANTNYHLRITAASLQIIDDSAGGVSDPVVDITPRGIDAASVTFGLARGGHNLVANSSFEMGAFVQSSAVVQTWDVAADFNAAGSRQGADVNVTTGATLITMTTVT